MDKLTQYTNTSLIKKTNELVDEVNNKANTSDLDNYLPLTGGTINGALILAPSNDKSVNNRGIQLSTESTWFDFGYNWDDQVGAGFVLRSSNYPNESGDSGSFLLYARNSESTTNLIANAYGAITWNGKNLVRSVNGSTADTAGNVTIDIPDTSNLVTTTQFNDSVTKLATKTDLTNYVPLSGSAVKTGSLSIKQGSIYTQYLFGQSGSKLDIEDNTGTTQLLLGDSTLSIKTGTNANAYKYAFSTNGITVTMPNSSDSSATVTKTLPITVNGEEADSDGNITIDLSRKADISSLANVATSGSYNDLKDKPTIPDGVTVDSELSSTSINPVQNKVISAALANINVDVATNDEIDDALSLASDGIVPTDGVLGISNGGTGASTIEGIRANLGISPTTDFATVAFSGSYNDLKNTPTIPEAVTVDNSMSNSSANPVQNKVIYEAISNLSTEIDKKVAPSDLATVATSGSYEDLSNKPTIPSAYTLPKATSSTLGGVKIGSNITVSSGTISLTKSNVTNALGYTPPTSDTTYSVATTSTNGLMSSTDKSKLDNISLDEYTKTSVANTWSATQTFNAIGIGFESYTTDIKNPSYATPENSFAHYNVTSWLTINMSVIASKLTNSESTVFTALITSDADRTLTISNAGTLYYTGSASDVAITAPGILLNILLSKNASGALTSVIQVTELNS